MQDGSFLPNDRLHKTSYTPLPDGEPILNAVPRVAYLPPFAGITDKESRSSVAIRNRLIGQGLSGGVIRNVLYDMWLKNQSERKRLRGDKTKISGADLAILRTTDPWEILQKTLGDLFQMGLTVDAFDDRYHTYLHVQTFRGKMSGATLKKGANDAPRDLMVEGSGFLQWLSVYALALSPDIDVVVLDEPDAHLHCSLQLELVNYLSELAKSKAKQVLMATHSTELIKSFEFKSILEVKAGKATYLAEDGRKIAVLAGIGTAFSPKLHALTQKKKMLIVEGDFDENILKIWAAINETQWPENVVVWQWTGAHKERRQLFTQIKKDIPDLKAISLRDRDDEADNSVGPDLIEKGHTATGDGFQALKWRRRHIDNYLICPAAISKAAEITEAEAIQFFADNHGLAIPANVTSSGVLIAIRDARGKELLSEGATSVESILGISRYDIAKSMDKPDIADDVKTFLATLTAFAAQ